MTSFTAQLELTSQVRMDREVANSLVGASDADAGALDCALARTVLWSLTRVGEPIHILRLMNVLLDVARSLSGAGDERALRGRLRAALDDLVDSGDVLELPGGRWHPAAVREVELGQLGDDRLLVGGLPTSAIPSELRIDIVHGRAFRRVRGAQLRNALGLPVEHFESWAGAPPTCLVEWAEDILTSQLAEYTEPRDESTLRIYAPAEARRSAPQGKRWRDRLDTASGRFLADRVRPFGRREFRIVEIHSGRVEHSGAILLPNEVRRLMYALDAGAANPVDVSYETEGEELNLTLWSELPRPEVRLLGALGSLHTSPERYYPRRWRFAARYSEMVLQRLRALGVRLVE